MADLNGAYYGPSIPPPEKPYRRRTSSCCGGGCVLSLLLKIIIAIVVVVALAGLIFWLVVRPRSIKFHVTDAVLTEFNHTATDNMIRYNLSLNVAVRNPNNRIGVYYDRIEARGYYKDKRFSTRFLLPFYQGHKNTTVLRSAFEGQQIVLFGNREIRDFDRERVSGVYSIDVEFRLRLRYKLGDLKSRRYKPKVDCELKVPLLNASDGNRGSGPGAFRFQTTKCDFDY